MGWYSWLVVNHPLVLILVNIALAFVLGPLTIITVGLPDFSDPQLGFEPRNSKTTIWEKVAANIFGRLVNRTLKYYPTNYTGFPETLTTAETGSRKKRFAANSSQTISICANRALANVDILDARIIVRSKTGADIFTADHLHSICRIQDAISSYPWPAKTCYMMSLPLYVTALANKLSCYNITDDDIGDVIGLLQRCSSHYFNGTLLGYCHIRNTCPTVPIECGNLNAVYTILHLLTDSGFLKDGDVNATKLDFSVIALPHGWYLDSKDLLLKYYLDHFETEAVQDGDIVVPALHMNIENDLFNRYVQEDITLYAVAMAMVIVVLLLYLQSFVLMIAVVTNVIITLCLSYFVYYYVIQMHFFPFINLIAALLLIAISADDVFIIYDLWRKEVRLNPDSSYETNMSETLRKGGLSIFVTSLTTAASLLANIANEITTIRCFGIFAGICILMNFLLMITWIPALIVVIEKTFHYCIPKTSIEKSRKCGNKLTKISDYFWGVIMMKIITIGSPIWIVLLLIIGILGLVAVFARPGLKLPDNNYLKVFDSENLFEKYRAEYKDRIRFEKQFQSTDNIQLVFLWGVAGVDNGDVWNPNDQGTLVYTPVDVLSEEVISWQNKFCHQLKKQPFVLEKHRNDQCFFETVESLLTGPCVLKPANQAWKKEVNLSPCCEISKPNRTMREHCMVFYEHITGAYLDRITGTMVLGEIILDHKNNIKLFSYTFHSTSVLTPSYVYMDNFYAEVEKFAKAELSDAPNILKDGWFASYIGSSFVFYDVQKEIAQGTMKGIGLSLTCSFIVLLVTSLNIIISLYAMFTITLVIGATVGTLVFLGWELNVTESLTITMSLGLAVDFTIHYGVTYKLEKSNSRADRVVHTVTTVCSAVSMAALTTFISGVSVLNARVLAYRQYGMFLVFIMFYSWIFSTFLFLPLCYTIGPLGHTGDLVYLFRCCCRKVKKRQQLTTASSASGGQPYLNGTVSAKLQYENLTNLKPVYFRRPDVSRQSALFSPGSLDNKFAASSDSLFDARERHPAGGRLSNNTRSTPSTIEIAPDRYRNRDAEDGTRLNNRDVYYWKIKRPKLEDR
ncbi:hypothetical protein LSH36_161g00041 [Paralvinella palmiformis]|uniref:SSD domain-containing protein n=1 Tax=Paralvinella palmiformis TaxID=53620 RepID=A0AAD9JT77_9ANNE|nr:hypothetical protein LSH36_161g00041 [Paralvinella palmiformis]